MMLVFIVLGLLGIALMLVGSYIFAYGLGRRDELRSIIKGYRLTKKDGD